MKAGLISIAAAGLATVAASHHARHEQFHKREVATTTVIDYITDVVEEIVVYVDEAGKPTATSTFWQTQVPKTEAPAPATTTSVAKTTVAVQASAEVSAAASAAASAQAPADASSAAKASPTAESSPTAKAQSGSGSFNPLGAVSSAAASAVSGSSGVSGDIGFGSGISYSPYHADGSCKSSDEIAKDLAADHFDVVRLYGTDCDQVGNTLKALNGKSTQLFVGIFDVGSWDSEAQTIIDAVNGDWSRINTVSVGNEIVNNGGSVSVVTSAVASTRSKLRSAGFKGPVVTVDTMVAHRSHPELCQASDFCAMNCHAFFDGHVQAEGAGEFVLGWVQQIASMHEGKEVIVTESGWPSAGSTNGECVPSEENQAAAVASLKGTFSSNMILYSMYNNKWMKSSPAQFNAEQFWGIMGDSPIY